MNFFFLKNTFVFGIFVSNLDTKNFPKFFEVFPIHFELWSESRL